MGAALTDADLQREMLAMFPYARQHGGKIPPSMEATVRQGALQMIEFEELVYQEAQRRKMQINPGRLDYAMSEFRQQFDSEANFSEISGRRNCMAPAKLCATESSAPC